MGKIVESGVEVESEPLDGVGTAERYPRGIGSASRRPAGGRERRRRGLTIGPPRPIRPVPSRRASHERPR